MRKHTTRRLNRLKRRVERKLQKRFEQNENSGAWSRVRQFLQTIWAASIMRYLANPIISVAWFVMVIALAVFLFEILSYYVLEANGAVA